MAQPQREEREEYYYGYQQQPQQQPITYTKTRTKKGINSSTSQHLIVLATLVPFGATLLILAGLTLTATVVGLSVTTPLFIFFSPVLVAAAVVIGLAIAGFLTSVAFGVTSLSSFAWLVSYLRRSRLLEQLKHRENVKHGLEDTVGHEAHIVTEEVSEVVEGKAQDETVQEAQIEKPQVGKAKKENRRSS